jgi:hypothetical protein
MDGVDRQLEDACGGDSLARQKYWEISPWCGNPKYPRSICNSETFKDYKKTRQVRDAG